MRTAVSDSSIANYHALGVAGILTAQQRRVYDFLARNCHCTYTRKEIARALGMDPGTVAGRVNELRDELHLVEELPIRKCGVSGWSAHAIRLRPLQAELFDELSYVTEFEGVVAA